MKFVSFTGRGSGPGYGALMGDGVVDLTRRLGPEVGSLRLLIASGRLAEAALLASHFRHRLIPTARNSDL